MNFRTLIMIFVGILAGATTGWQSAQSRLYGDPADANYRARQAEARPARLTERPKIQRQLPASSPEIATAFVRKLEETPFEIGMAFREDRHDFSIDQRGQLNSEEMKALEIPLEAKPRLQKIVNAAIDQATEDMLTRVRPNLRGTDPGKGTVAYDIPADIEAGKAYLEQAERDFSTVVTPEQASRLAKSMDRLLGGFGRQAVRIVASTDPSSGQTVVRYGCYNPYLGSCELNRQIEQDPLNRGPIDDLVEKVMTGRQ